jgi:hypothetical protein
MANTLKFGNGQWGTKVGSTLAYNDEGGNFKPLPFNFTRSTSGTRVNKDGLIEVVTNNKPRIDFLNDSNGALLLEPSRSNLALYSEQFNNAAWIGSAVTRSANEIISPDGSQNADKLTASATFSNVGQSYTSVNDADYTLSVFVKLPTSNQIGLRLSSGANDVRRAFNLSTLSISAMGGNNQELIDEGIEDYGNGWYRCYLTCKADGTSATANIYPKNSSDGTLQSVYAWGAQLEAGSYATSYIPTQGAISTKVAETCNDAGNDQVFNGSEGVLFVEMSALANDSTTRRINLRNSSGSNQIRIEFGNSSNLISAVLFNGANQAVINNTSNNILNSNKIAFKYKENDFALWINGVEVGTDIIGTTIGAGILDRIDLSLSPNQTYSNIKQIQYFNTALTDLQLQQLTTL